MAASRAMKPFVRAVFSGAVVMAILAAGAERARAADDEDNSPSIWNLDTRIWSGLMSAMGMRNGEVGVDYRERSPLVVPTTKTLPPPQSASPKSTAWPLDPEVKRRQEAASRKPKSARPYDPESGYNALPPSQVGPRTDPRASARASADASSAQARAGEDALKPSELGYFGGLFSFSMFGQSSNRDETGTFVSEPPRTSLTTPPAGYQTPSPDQPYGNAKRVEYRTPKPGEWMTQ